MNICAVSDETYDCWKDYVKGELNVIFEYKTTKSFSFLIIFVIFVPIMYGGESVQNISKDDVQSIEIGIKNLVLVFSNGLTVHYYNLCYNT